MEAIFSKARFRKQPLQSWFGLAWSDPDTREVGVIEFRFEVGVVVEDSEETAQLVRSAIAGEAGAVERLLRGHADRLGGMIGLRLDRRLAARVDAADVVQEVLLVAYQRHEFDLELTFPFYVWLRAIAVNKLLELHRRHLGTEMRDAHREVSLERTVGSGASSEMLAGCLVDTGTSPSGAAMRLELRALLETILDQLPSTTRRSSR